MLLSAYFICIFFFRNSCIKTTYWHWYVPCIKLGKNLPGHICNLAVHVLCVAASFIYRVDGQWCYFWVHNSMEVCTEKQHDWPSILYVQCTLYIPVLCTFMFSFVLSIETRCKSCYNISSFYQIQLTNKVYFQHWV